MVRDGGQELVRVGGQESGQERWTGQWSGKVDKTVVRDGGQDSGQERGSVDRTVVRIMRLRLLKMTTMMRMK